MSVFTDKNHAYAGKFFEDDGFGPLPPKWETAFTDRGELYFIDHNTGTSHWLDPRLSKYQKKALEDCCENELPYGWEKIEDSMYGTYFIDHVNRRTQYENPVLEAKRQVAEQHPENQKNLSDSLLASQKITQIKKVEQRNSNSLLRCKFTRNRSELQGQRITVTLIKSVRGFGITLVSGNGVNINSEIVDLLQIKTIVPNGPAWVDGQLQTGDVLVYVNDSCALGCTYDDMINIFQSILPGEKAMLHVCRGYKLPFDSNDPDTEMVTTLAVNGAIIKPDNDNRCTLMDYSLDDNLNFLNTLHTGVNKPADNRIIQKKKAEVLTFFITKCIAGFGFTISDSVCGQKVKTIIDRKCCTQLCEGDVLLEINGINIQNKSHKYVVEMLNKCNDTTSTKLKILRIPNEVQMTCQSICFSNAMSGNTTELFRSKTPTADLYSVKKKEVLPIRPKTPIIDTRYIGVKNYAPKAKSSEDLVPTQVRADNYKLEPSDLERLHFEDFFPKNFIRLGDPYNDGAVMTKNFVISDPLVSVIDNQIVCNYNSAYNPGSLPTNIESLSEPAVTKNQQYTQNESIEADRGHHGNCYCYGCFLTNKQIQDLSNANSFAQKSTLKSYFASEFLDASEDADQYELTEVTLEREPLGFGFRIVGGTEEGSQVTVGHIVPGGAADKDRRIVTGDEILSIDGINVVNSSHHKVVSFVGESALRGQITLILRRRRMAFMKNKIQMEDHQRKYPYEVNIGRNESESFGFVIISTSNQHGSIIGKLIPGSPAHNCGELKVGDHIIAVNRLNILGMSHGDVVNLIKESGLQVQLTIGLPINEGDNCIEMKEKSFQEASVDKESSTDRISTHPYV